MRLSILIVPVFAGIALGGCATASSSSFTQAPLFFSSDGEGTTETAAADEVLAPYGTRDRGIANYSVAGGNALLPVRAVTPLDAGVQASLLDTPVGVTAEVGPGGALDAGAQAALLNTPVGVTATAGQTNTGAAVNVGAVGVATNLTGGTITNTIAVPGNTTTTVVSPNVSVGPSSLITVGPVLGNTAAVVQPVVGNAAGALNTTATDLQRLCALRVCR